jgi:hypothetical protein
MVLTGKDFEGLSGQQVEYGPVNVRNLPRLGCLYYQLKLGYQNARNFWNILHGPIVGMQRVCGDD